jgi:hypothetical protein
MLPPPTPFPSCSCCISPWPEMERVKEEGLEDDAEEVPVALPLLMPAPVMAERMSPLELLPREPVEAKEMEEEVRLLLLPGGRPGPRTCGTHLMPREVHIWQGLRRLQRFCVCFCVCVCVCECVSVCDEERRETLGHICVGLLYVRTIPIHTHRKVQSPYIYIYI